MKDMRHSSLMKFAVILILLPIFIVSFNDAQKTLAVEKLTRAPNQYPRLYRDLAWSQFLNGVLMGTSDGLWLYNLDQVDNSLKPIQTEIPTTQILVSPDGKLVALTASETYFNSSGLFSIWNLETDEKLYTITNQGFLNYNTFSNDSRFLYIPSPATLYLFDTQNDAKSRRLTTMFESVQILWASATSIDDSLLAVSTNNGNLEFWDTSTNTRSNILSRKITNSLPLIHISFDRSGRFLVGYDVEGYLFIWYSVDGHWQTIRELEFPPVTVRRVQFCWNDRTLITVDHDSSIIRIWSFNETSLTLRSRIMTNSSMTSITCVGSTPNLLGVLSLEGELQFWELGKDNPQKQIKFEQ